MEVEKELTLPSWLNSEFLTSTIGDDVIVTHVNVKRAVAKGDNYLSVLFRVLVEYQERQQDPRSCSLIIKTIPDGEAMRKFLAEMQGFEKELHMYQVTLPAIHKLFGDASRDITARALTCPRKDVIVLEDLQTMGYRMAERSRGLDLDHAVQTVRALAFLHAGSVGLLKQDPTSLDEYEETFFADVGERRETHKGYFNMHIQTLVTQIERWTGYEHFAPRVRKLMDVAIDYMMDMVQPKQGSLSVLNHGDCWVNNMLYSYDDDTGKVRDVRFVDFQIARYASPALDLQYFLNTSLNDEIRFKEVDRLLEEYHQELTSRFAQLGISEDTYTLQQLKKDYEDTALFGFLTACTLLCIVLADRSAAPDFSDLPEDKSTPEKNPLEKAYEGHRFREVFETFLVHYQNSGIF